jgi:hypothetical protein
MLGDCLNLGMLGGDCLSQCAICFYMIKVSFFLYIESPGENTVDGFIVYALLLASLIVVKLGCDLL